MLTSQGQQNELMNNNTFVLSGILAHEFSKLRKNKLSNTSVFSSFLNVMSKIKCLRPKILRMHIKYMTYTLYRPSLLNIFCFLYHKDILYGLTFVFRTKQIDKCFVIFISYEIKSNIILVIFRE